MASPQPGGKRSRPAWEDSEDVEVLKSALGEKDQALEASNNCATTRSPATSAATAPTTKPLNRTELKRSIVTPIKKTMKYQPGVSSGMVEATVSHLNLYQVRALESERQAWNQISLI